MSALHLDAGQAAHCTPKQDLAESSRRLTCSSPWLISAMSNVRGDGTVVWLGTHRLLQNLADQNAGSYTYLWQLNEQLAAVGGRSLLLL